MAQNSKIEWTDATFNPWIGCVRVSTGCQFCYAETLDKRALWDNKTHWGPTASRLRTSPSNWKQPLAWNKEPWSECLAACGWRGNIRKAPIGKDGYYHCLNCGGLTKPTRRRVFCASLADVFEDNGQLPEWRLDLFELIRQTPNLDWLLLTKRPGNVNRMIADMFGDCYWLEDYGKNIWIGTSVEDQAAANKRIPDLLKVPAAVRFLSCEPLLGPVDLGQACPCGYYCDQTVGHVDHPFWTPGLNTGIHWIIVGGESGSNARPMHPDWARSIRDQCQAAGIPFFFKQWGQYIPYECADDYIWHSQHGDTWWQDESFGKKGIKLFHNKLGFISVGKHKSGRLLDGREWNEMPQKNDTDEAGQ